MKAATLDHTPAARPSNWQRYVDLLEREQVPDRARPYYVRHVERFIAAFPGRRLSTFGQGEIETYLQRCAATPRLAAWQFQQVVDALHLLLVKLNDCRSAREIDWMHWRALEPSQHNPTGSVDPVPQRVVGGAGWSDRT